jgi:hypothetical protein
VGRIIRVKINWTGFQGGPGYSNLYFEPVPESDPWTTINVQAAVDKTQTWLATWRTALPATVVTGIDSQVAELDEQSGNIESFFTAAVVTPAPGTQAGTYSAPSGACVNWTTGGVRNGRRVRGRTFMVPISSFAMSPDGTFENTFLGNWRAAAATFTGDSNGNRLVVWARPTPGALIPDGGAYDVIGSSINDKAAVLTSRRD